MSRPDNGWFQCIARQFAGIDLRSLAAFRIGLGVVLLWDLSTSLGSASAFYSNDGFLPLAVLDQFRESPWLWSVHTLSGSCAWQIALLILHMAAAVCLLVGYRTQVATVLCWALLCSLLARNPTVLHSGDVALRLLCFWSIFLPLGARWSVDEWRGRISTFSDTGRVSTFASFGILLQICLIYWMSALLKDGVEWRRDGSAVYYALSLDQFVTSTGKHLLQFPALCRAFTFGTWWLEVVGPIVALFTFRAPIPRVLTVAVFFTLHVGLWISFRLGPFAPTMLSAWLLFLPSEFWDALEKRFRCFPRFSSATSVGNERHLWMRHSLTQCFSLVCIVYVALWNLRGANIKHHDKWFPQWVNPFGYVLYLQQYWTMFAPRPPTDDGWVIMEAVLANGARVDLLRDGRPVSFDKPALISAEFRNSKWQKAILSLWPPLYRQVRTSFGNCMAFQWNATHPAAEQILGWTLWYMREDTLPNNSEAKPVKIEMLKAGRK
jgi:Vitamin K-dependent gamma-carboxylase